MLKSMLTKLTVGLIMFSTFVSSHAEVPMATVVPDPAPDAWWWRTYETSYEKEEMTPWLWVYGAEERGPWVCVSNWASSVPINRKLTSVSEATATIGADGQLGFTLAYTVHQATEDGVNLDVPAWGIMCLAANIVYDIEYWYGWEIQHQKRWTLDGIWEYRDVWSETRYVTNHELSSKGIVSWTAYNDSQDPGAPEPSAPY